MLTDEAIMEKVKIGDINQMSSLFERHHSAVYSYFYRLTRKQSLSEDLTQNVFERIIKYRQSYNSMNKFKSWMFSVARNVHYDHYRKNKIVPIDHENMQELNVKADCLNTTMDKKEKVQFLEKALNRLDKETKELIILTRIERLKYHEVAAIMQVSEGAIKLRVHRGMKKLKEEYFLGYN